MTDDENWQKLNENFFQIVLQDKYWFMDIYLKELFLNQK